jgi:hypothetical protein
MVVRIQWSQERPCVYRRPTLNQHDTAKYLPKGISFNNMQHTLNTNCQRKNAKAFPFYSARPRTATKYQINTKEHAEHVLYPFIG